MKHSKERGREGGQMVHACRLRHAWRAEDQTPQLQSQCRVAASQIQRHP
jgi:hypothetical protein